jgi:hypothetical protein
LLSSSSSPPPPPSSIIPFSNGCGWLVGWLVGGGLCDVNSKEGPCGAAAAAANLLCRRCCRPRDISLSSCATLVTKAESGSQGFFGLVSLNVQGKSLFVVCAWRFHLFLVFLLLLVVLFIVGFFFLWRAVKKKVCLFAAAAAGSSSK